MKFSGACHKHFRTRKQADDFIADWIEMYACMVKDHIKEELLHGYRPEQMTGSPVTLTLKPQNSEEEDELAAAMSKSGLAE